MGICDVEENFAFYVPWCPLLPSRYPKLHLILFFKVMSIAYIRTVNPCVASYEQSDQFHIQLFQMISHT